MITSLKIFTIVTNKSTKIYEILSVFKKKCYIKTFLCFKSLFIDMDNFDFDTKSIHCKTIFIV